MWHLWKPIDSVRLPGRNCIFHQLFKDFRRWQWFFCVWLQLTTQFYRQILSRLASNLKTNTFFKIQFDEIFFQIEVDAIMNGTMDVNVDSTMMPPSIYYSLPPMPWFGMDIGGTLTKLVYFEPTGAWNEVLCLKKISWNHFISWKINNYFCERTVEHLLIPLCRIWFAQAKEFL